jgi:hypothetical protein
MDPTLRPMDSRFDLPISGTTYRSNGLAIDTSSRPIHRSAWISIRQPDLSIRQLVLSIGKPSYRYDGLTMDTTLQQSIRWPHLSIAKPTYR